MASDSFDSFDRVFSTKIEGSDPSALVIIEVLHNLVEKAYRGTCQEKRLIGEIYRKSALEPGSEVLISMGLTWALL